VDFNALKTELAARGFDYLSDTRQGYFINAARHELDMMELWPYRITTLTAQTPPVTITDLGTVAEVIDTGNGSVAIAAMDRGELRHSYSDLTITGTPSYFYVDNGTLQTYPIGGTLSIRYYKRTADLSGATDLPLSPTQYHLLIVDMASRWAHKDSDDNMVLPTLSAEIERQVALMRADLLGSQQSANVGYIHSEGTDI
jgi:hypothetical protein